MEIFIFVWHMLVWSVTVALLFPLTIPWAKLAYKIWQGHKEIDEELAEQMWIRATLVSFGLFVLAVALVLCDWATVDWLDMAKYAGPIHIIYFAVLLTLAPWLMMYIFSMEDFFEGLNITVIFFCIPMALFFLLSLLFDNPLQVYLVSWLVKPEP